MAANQTVLLIEVLTERTLPSHMPTRQPELVNDWRLYGLQLAGSGAFCGGTAVNGVEWLLLVQLAGKNDIRAHAGKLGFVGAGSVFRYAHNDPPELQLA